MKGELVIIDHENKVEKCDKGFASYSSYFDYSLFLYVDENTDFTKQVKDKEFYKEFMEYIDENTSEDAVDKYEYLVENYDNLLDAAEYVKIDFNGGVKKFILNNPILLTKKIVLPDYLVITDIDRVSNLMIEYQDMLDNIYVSLKGNSKYVSLKDCRDAVFYINGIANHIKSLGLSPLEALMYAL